MFSRRDVLAACASIVGMRALGEASWAAKAQERAVAVYQVDIEELGQAFPGGSDMSRLPRLLVRFGEWLAGKPWRSVGGFDLDVRWSDLGFAGGEFFYDQFALFIKLADGSSVGYWLADRDLARAPIVVLGSEGDDALLAPDLETFLARIALGDFDNKGPASDFLYSDEDYGDGVVPDLRGAMQAFLRDETGIRDLQSLARRGRSSSRDFAQWVAKAVEAYNAKMQAHPAVEAMTSILESYRPAKAQPWQSLTINVAWAGKHFDAWAAPDSIKSLAEAEQLRPHLGALRDEAAAKKPGLGLWHRAWLNVSKDRLDFTAD